MRHGVEDYKDGMTEKMKAGGGMQFHCLLPAQHRLLIEKASFSPQFP
jgi:hypothetical protein